ncbi:MAG: Rieske (2Fe-2S) protein [Gammaproteobacteria bacterium]|nr:Rieske (2Fe-2S) protein [Gammaproteobacteria bacterium]
MSAVDQTSARTGWVGRTGVEYLKNGGFFVISDYPNREQFVSQVRRAIIDAAGELHGSRCKEGLKRVGLHKLHEHFPVEQASLLRRAAMQVLRKEILTTMTKIGQDRIGLIDPFYIGDGLNLRIVYPFPVARNARSSLSHPHASDYTSNPQAGDPLTWLDGLVRRGAGRIRGVMRGLVERQHTAFDLKKYNRNLPAAAWSHGPHLDSWWGQNLNNINTWCAISGVSSENSMVLYPDMFGRDISPDPASNYIKPGYRLGRPTKIALEDGEILVFNPEILHSSHLNISDVTRIVVSARLTQNEPEYNKGALHVEDKWHVSTNISARSHFAPARFGKRSRTMKNEVLRPAQLRDESESILLAKTITGNESIRVCDRKRFPRSGRLLVKLNDAEVLIIKHMNVLRAVSGRCPHLGIDLIDGHDDGQKIYCPGHAVAFDLDTGMSSCPALGLRRYFVHEDADGVYLRKIH